MEKGIVGTLWRLLEKFHRRIYALLVFVVMNELLKLAPAAVLAIVIDRVVAFNPSQAPLMYMLVGGLFVASMAVSLLDIHIEYGAIAIAFDAETTLLRRSSKRLLTLSLGYHERRNSAALIHILHRGCYQLVDLIYFSCKEFGPTLIQLFITLLVLLWIGWIPALMFLVFLPVFGLLIHRYGVRVQPLRSAYHGKLEQAAGRMGERIAHIRTVQDYAVEERELQSYSGILDEYVSLQRRRLDYQRRYFLYRDISMNIARAAIMALGIWLVTVGRMTPGVLVFFITLTEKANISLFRIANLYNRVGDNVESIRRLSTLLEETSEVTEYGNAADAPTLNGHIEFSGVSFGYNQNKDVLRDISFEVKPGQMVAIVGRSGSGKSTIVKLLYRHFDIQRGEIKVDGRDIRSYTLGSYRRQLASVQQDIEIFNATVRTNIAFGDPDATMEQIERAAQTACADGFINDLPKSYDTLVGERGVKLSGGQKQRIGIARALLVDPAILIFDEATSSLDTESEQLIQRAMLEIAKQRTMIVIAHRLSTVEHADRVIVLEDGRIAEMGTHDDLMRESGIYRKMRELQRLGEVRS